MTYPIFYINNQLYLSYAFLRHSGITKKRYERWISERWAMPVRIEETACLRYDDISRDARSILKPKDELIALCRIQNFDAATQQHIDKMKYLKNAGFVKHKIHLRTTYQLSGTRLTVAAQAKAVWDYVLALKESSKDLEALYQAFNAVYLNKYSSKVSFANAIKKAREKGTDAMCVDSRWFAAPQNIKRISASNALWAASLVSMGAKHTNSFIWCKLKELCDAAGQQAPSKSWIDKYRKQLLKNPGLFTDRNGSQQFISKKLPYVSTHHATRPNDQWQLDGMNMPFWVACQDDKKRALFTRPVLVLVRDAYSKKVIGWAFGRSENTVIIMEALKDAVINTSSLPFEILTDNHAANQTKEISHFVAEIEKLGAKWTITSNPQHKAIIERYNQHLNEYFKEYYGYTGEGIKSKRSNAHPKQERIDEYAKPQNQLSELEAKSIALTVIERFNESATRAKSFSPNALYSEGDKSSCITIGLFERMRLLTARTEIKVNRGQINIRRGPIKYEYQLPAEYYIQYNDEAVVVRYEDLSDCIYLYDKKTDEPITALHQKPKIHGAKANQTEEDIKQLQKHKGRIKGIEAAGKKQNEELLKKALEENPDAIYLLNQATTPKDVRKEIEQNAALRKLAADKGIDLNRLHVPARKNELEKSQLVNPPKKSKGPFQMQEDHVMGIVMPDDLEE